MNIIEKYEIYKKGLVPRNCGLTLQKFFKTNPTTDQLLYLSQMTREDSAWYAFGLGIYLLFGIIIGVTFSLFTWFPVLLK